LLRALRHTGAAEDAGDLNKLDGDPARPISDEPSAEKFVKNAHLAESIIAMMRYAQDWVEAVDREV
jgi:hypothetical protein